MRLEARACLWMLPCVQEMFGTTVSDRVTNPHVHIPMKTNQYISFLWKCLLVRSKISYPVAFSLTALQNNMSSWPLLSLIQRANSNKKKAVPLHAMEALGGERYSSYSFTTSALDGGEWSASRPGRALPPGKGAPVPIVQEAGWAPEPFWTQRLGEKSFAPAGDRTPIARSFSP
jgi:hypothetical protein